MSKKDSVIFVCTHCDAQFPKWNGRCTECGKWGTVESSSKEATIVTSKKTPDTKIAAKTQTLAQISSESAPRISTDISEFDAVLGGGLVHGSLILLGGDPGIGKSTLSLQVLSALGKQNPKALPLYVSGEESGQQIKLRADRLGVEAKSIAFLSQTHVETIIATIHKQKPSLVIVDSIQTIYSSDAESEPGSVTQVRACTVKLLEAAKSTNTPLILIGHVTKDGQVAGPKTLEHLVDTVLYLEGDRYQTFRLLRTVKNRFGPTNEVGVFEMTQAGLEGVANPSALFITQQTDLPGTAITCILEGTRPFLVEVQALVTKSVYASPQRRGSGFDVNRLQLLLAVLNQRTNYNFANKDIHINVVGGLKVQDPGVDLAICAALISALENKTLDKQLIVLGEVGLAGEIRPVRQLQERLKESFKLGYKKAWIPEQPIKTSTTTKVISNLSDL